MRATAHIFVIGRHVRDALAEVERTAFQLRCARSVAHALAVLKEHTTACEVLEQVVTDYRVALQVFHEGCKDVITNRPRGVRS